MSRLAAPVLVEETLTLMVTWTDWWLTGHFLREGGDAVKAAMGLMGYTMWLIPSMFAAVAIGATALIARRVGEGKFNAAQHTTNQAILVGIGLAVAATLLTALAGDDFIRVMQLRNGAAAYANTYLQIIVPVIPLIMFTQVGSACLRGAGDTVTGSVAKSIVVLVNIAVSTTLVMGLFGIQPLGWQGIAYGTAIGHAVGGVILLIALLGGRAGMKLNWPMLKPHISLIRRLMRIGIPGGIEILVLLMSQLVFVAIINSLGEAAAAAHGLAVQIEACAFLPANAFQVAAATIVGQFLGAGRPDRATRGALACVSVALAIVAVAGIAMFFGGHLLSAFFTGDIDHPTTRKAAELLRIVALALPSLAIVMVTSGALRGAGDTIWPLIITMLGFFLIRIPLAVVLSMEQVNLPILGLEFAGGGLGVAGAWIAMAIDLVLRSVMISARFVSGGWKHTKV